MYTSALNVLICLTTLPSHGRGHKFETCTAHQNNKNSQVKIRRLGHSLVSKMLFQKYDFVYKY